MQRRFIGVIAVTVGVLLTIGVGKPHFAQQRAPQPAPSQAAPQRGQQPAPAPPAAAAQRGQQSYKLDQPARLYGHPNFSGIWQTINSANWNLEAHSAESLPDFWKLGAMFAIPAGRSVVREGTIPY